MCRLFETIRIVDGVPVNMPWHRERMRLAGNELRGGDQEGLADVEIVVPQEFSMGLVRCNVHFDIDKVKISFSVYYKRPIRSLKLVYCDTLDYHLKYTDRSALDSLFLLREKSDDIIIVKNGLIADTSMSNLVFFDGKDWVTPAKPLLKGTCRSRLLEAGVISEKDITPGDLGNYLGCKLINAMREPGEEEMIPVSEIS